MTFREKISFVQNLIKDSAGKSIKCSDEEMLGLYGLLSGDIDKSAKLDRFGRILAKNSFQKKLGVLDKPIVNIFLKQKCKTSNFWPDGKKWAVALTHDVDRVEKYGINFKNYFKIFPRLNMVGKIDYFFRALFGFVKRIRDKKDYWNFHKIIALEEKYGFRSTFFFGATNFWETGSKYDFVYDVKDRRFQKVFWHIDHVGGEVGLHGSFNSCLTSHSLKKEKKNLEILIGKKIIGTRMHYWRLNWKNQKESYTLIEKAGLGYSTLGWNDEPGFVYGIALPFRPLNNKNNFLEIPTTIMDETVMHKIRPLKDIEKQFNIIRSTNGLAVLDWHNHVFCKEDFPRWAKTYEEVLDILSRDDEVWVAPLGEIYRWWKKRIKNF